MAGLNINGNDDWNYHETQISNNLPDMLSADISNAYYYYAHPGFLIFKNNYAQAISLRGSNITFLNPAWNENDKDQRISACKIFILVYF